MLRGVCEGCDGSRDTVFGGVENIACMVGKDPSFCSGVVGRKLRCVNCAGILTFDSGPLPSSPFTTVALTG